MAQFEKPYLVGIDLGGTNVRAAVIERGDEQIVARGENISSRGLDGPDITAMQIALAAKTALQKSGRVLGLRILEHFADTLPAR